MIEGLGCLYLYYKIGHNFDEGYKECELMGGDLFEIEDFDRQQVLLYNFLFANGGMIPKDLQETLNQF